MLGPFIFCNCKYGFHYEMCESHIKLNIETKIKGEGKRLN